MYSAYTDHVVVPEKLHTYWTDLSIFKFRSENLGLNHTIFFLNFLEPPIPPNFPDILKYKPLIKKQLNRFLKCDWFKRFKNRINLNWNLRGLFCKKVTIFLIKNCKSCVKKKYRTKCVRYDADFCFVVLLNGILRKKRCNNLKYFFTRICLPNDFCNTIMFEFDCGLKNVFFFKIGFFWNLSMRFRSDIFFLSVFSCCIRSVCVLVKHFNWALVVLTHLLFPSLVNMINMCPQRELNTWPPGFQPGALPLSYVSSNL